MGRDHADGRGSEGPAANYLNIFVRLGGVGDRPGDGHGVAHVDVFIDCDDQFADAVAVVEHPLHCVPRFLVVALFQTDDNIGPKIYQRFHKVYLVNGIQPAFHQKTFDEGGHAHGFNLRAFAGRDLADNRYPDGIFSVRDALQFEYRAQGAGIDISHGFAEGTFFLHIVCWNDSFENDLRGCWNLQIDGLTLDEL